MVYFLVGMVYFQLIFKLKLYYVTLSKDNPFHNLSFPYWVTIFTIELERDMSL